MGSYGGGSGLTPGIAGPCIQRPLRVALRAWLPSRKRTSATAAPGEAGLPLAGEGLISDVFRMEVMSDAIGPGDLVLCVNVAPNHATGRPVALRAGETYRVVAVMEFACPCGRSDALLDVGVDFAWCQTRFRLLPKPKAEAKTRRVSAPKEKETVR